MNNWTLDLAVDGVKYVNDDPGQGAQVTVANLGQLVLPATVEVDFKDGSKTRVKLPVETWLAKGTYTFEVDSKVPVMSVTIDPDHVLPDSDRTNNMLKM